MICNNYSTHRVASTGFLNYISTSLTFHSTAKQRVITSLMNVDLAKNDIATLKQCASNYPTSNFNNNEILTVIEKNPAENDNAIVFLEFDLSTKRIGFRNGNARVTTVAYEMRCHPDHATILKPILI